MSVIAKQDLTIVKGKTFQQVLRWESPPTKYVAISAITQTAPVAITTAVSHTIPEGWRVAVESVKGMTQINAGSPLKDKDYHQATVVDSTHIELNEINAMDFAAYKSGGVLRYNTPVDLTGYTARMKIKDKVGGTSALELTTENGRITLNTTLYTITMLISATDTASLTLAKGVYDLELVSSTGVVTALLAGKVTVEDEVTV